MVLKSGNLEPLVSEPAVFMGATVTSFNGSVGWNSETSNCQIELVEDPLNPHGNLFKPPTPGTACVFTFGANDNSAHEMDGGLRSDIFRFGGILQQWTKRESLSGNTYSLVLTTPTAALEGSQVILNSYQGFTNFIQNVFNPFGVRENWYYSEDAYFGGAKTNSAGYQWTMLLADLTTLVNNDILDGIFGGQYIKYSESKFKLDLTELEELTDWLSTYRVGGTNMSILVLIKDICEAASCDFIVDMRGGKPNKYTGICEEVSDIFVRIIPRRSAPTLGVIESFVESAKAEGIVESAEHGLELGGNVTAKLVLGGPQSRYWDEATSPPLGGGDLLPIWYTSDGGQHILGTDYAPSSKVPVRLEGGNVYQATVLELRCAMSGKHAWETYIQLFHPTWNWPSRARALDHDNGLLRKNIKQNLGNANDLVNTRRKNMILMASMHYGNQIHEYIDRVFNAIKSTADGYYGKKFLVPLPVEPGGISNNIKFVREDMDFVAAWEIAGSAWVENMSIFDINFYDSDGKLTPTVAYNQTANTDYSQLGSDYTLLGNLVVANSCTVTDKIIWYNNRPWCAIEVPQVTRVTNDSKVSGLWALYYYYGGVGAPPVQKKTAGVGSGNNNFRLPFPAIFPTHVGIPQESTRVVYGPWWRVGDEKGRVEVEYDTNLRPEVFAGHDKLNEAAFTKALIGSVNLQTSETGNLSLAQLPKFSLGDRFEEQGPYVTSMDVKAGIGGFITGYSFETWTVDFGKIAKYNVDRISNINKNTIRVLQEMRKAVKNPPFPSLKPKEVNKEGKAGKNGALGGLGGNNGVIAGAFNPPASAPGVMVSMEKLEDTIAHVAVDWRNKALCSLDVLFSPVVINKGYGGAKPGFEKPLASTFVGGGRFGGGKSVMPTVAELDPFWAWGDHNYEICTRDGDVVELLSRYADDKGQAKEQYRPVGLRGPIILSSWGYDLYDHPTPRDEYGDMHFSKEHKLYRSKWRSGPIDLAWDEFRKVWTTRLPMKEGIITKADNPGGLKKPDDHKTPTTVVMQVWDTATEEMEDESGWSDTTQKLTLTNRDPSLGFKWSEIGQDDVYAMSVYINYEWRPIWVGCGKTTRSVEETTDDTTTDDTTSTSTSGSTVPDEEPDISSGSATYT